MNKFLQSPLNEDEADKTGRESEFKTRSMYTIELPTQGFKSMNKIEENKEE